MGRVEFNKYKRMVDLYRQFKCSSVQLRITSDLRAMDNAISCTFDRFSETPITDIQVMKSQSHRDHIPNASSRVCVYGHTFSGTEAEWHMGQDSIIDADVGYIKILQQLNPHDYSKDAVLTLQTNPLVAGQSADTTGAGTTTLTQHPMSHIRLKVDVICNMQLKDQQFTNPGAGSVSNSGVADFQ